MNKGLEQFDKLKTWYILKMVEGNELLLRNSEKEMLDIIEKELKDYQEIREIAKRYNWDDITGEIFNVETDKKYRDLFNSAIVNIQEDYRKARALEIIKEKNVWFWVFRRTHNVNEYNEKVAMYYPECDELTQEEYDILKEVML